MEKNEASQCPLCHNEKVKIYAVGECFHPVCYLCSTKMRILCEQTYCAICRQELPQVYFVSDLSETQPTIDQSRFTPIDGTGDCGIYFPTKADWIRRQSEKLLRNFCPFCYTEYETFEILRDHVRRTHRYFYCDLCVEHLNLFPHERKCYTRHDLVQHIRYGDRDDTSFKGHPLCKFCDDHFLDSDHLFKHMRKEHYFCHLCTTDNVYYSDFDLLRDHYRSKHYLCEIGQCKEVQFTNVFANEIDFRAHQAAQHSKNRAEARQLGTIPVEFQSRNVRERRQQHDPAHRGTFRSGEFNTQGNNPKNERDDIKPEPAVPITVPSIDEFPTLGDSSTTSQNPSQQRGAWTNESSRNIHSSDNFPALGNAAGNAPNVNPNQPRGIWREQQQQQIPSTSSVSQSTTVKKGGAQSLTNGASSNITNEDFPALRTATNAKIPGNVSILSAWSNIKKSGKTANANAKANQPQMRMNTNRLLNDDDEDSYVRRPMSSLTTNTTPNASSNITIISSSDLPNAQINEKQNKNQSVPNVNDFPALSSKNSTQTNTTITSGVWGTGGTDPSTNSSTTQQKKKKSASKKKFLEELQSMSTPPSLSSMSDFPAMSLTELGQRLINEENQSTVTEEVKEEKSPQTSIVKQDEKKENKLTIASKKKTQKPNKVNDSTQQEGSSSKDETPVKPVITEPPSTKNETPVKPVITEISSAKNETQAKSTTKKISPTKNETRVESTNKEVSSTKTEIPTKSPTKEEEVTSQSLSENKPTIEKAASSTTSLQSPPGFNTPNALPPPPGFNPMATSQSTSPSFIFSSSYTKQKDEFYNKLFLLFDGDTNLLVEYGKFCDAFAQNQITLENFLKYSTELFKDKLEEYLRELIVIIPNIEQQNELYSISKKDIQHLTSSGTKNNSTNWTKKNSGENNIHICRICRQIMFETDIDEHNSNHTEFNNEFPSLPAAAVSLGRTSEKKKK